MSRITLGNGATLDLEIPEMVDDHVEVRVTLDGEAHRILWWNESSFVFLDSNDEEWMPTDDGWDIALILDRICTPVMKEQA